MAPARKAQKGPALVLRKVLYTLLFVVALPLSLVAWARAASPYVRMPAPFAPWTGAAAALAALGLMVAGLYSLWSRGGGLQVNPFPPSRLVTSGPYRYLGHPVYVGFCVAVEGVALVFRSGSGFWLVGPMVMLGCAALVFGYERGDLEARFGTLPVPAVRLPPDDPAPPTWMDRVSAYLLVLGPWAILYEGLKTVGAPPDAWSALLPREGHLPVVQWMELFYISIYPMAALAPLVAATRRDLRRFSVRALMAMALVFPMYLTLPFVVPARAFTPTNFFGHLIVWERIKDTPAEAFPSFHVIWALLAGEVFAGRMPKLKWFWRAWAWMIAAGCVLTGAHAFVDVAAGFAVVGLVSHAGAVWGRMRGAAERLANSWTEWRLGGLRVVNQGFYAGLAGFAALAIAGTLAGPGDDAGILLTALAGLVGAAVWPQVVGSAPRLPRPYGYYGALLGVAVGAAAMPELGLSPWLVLAAFAVAAPWAQALGRLRCLVQGCCHGRPAPSAAGIRYTRADARVCRFTGWKGVPLHPTPLYSVLWNVPVAMGTLRLWTLHVPLTFIAGFYLLLTGFGRFVEEAFRGEPQTPVCGGLGLYQWTAIASVVAGAVLTCLGGAAAPAIHLRWQVLPPALLFGFLAFLTTGVDFPGSRRRFGPLA